MSRDRTKALQLPSPMGAQAQRASAAPSSVRSSASLLLASGEAGRADDTAAGRGPENLLFADGFESGFCTSWAGDDLSLHR